MLAGSTLAEFHTRQVADVRMPSLWPVNLSLPRQRQPPHGVLAAGHRHLYSLLSVHDLLRRQGVTAAYGLLTDAQVADVLDACAYFDLHDLAATVAEIPWRPHRSCPPGSSTQSTGGASR